MASMFYNTVKEMSRRGNATANALFRTKEGKVIIENITPKLTGGSRKVIDDVRKSKLNIKEDFEAQETDV